MKIKSMIFILYIIYLTYSNSFHIRYNLLNKLHTTSLLQSKDAKVQSSEESLLFGGLKFYPPISTSMYSLNITKPTSIQQASLTQIASGLSCILHASTGTGINV